MTILSRTLLSVALLAACTQAVAQITFFQEERFSGRTLSVTQRVNDLERAGFGRQAGSAVVLDERWEVCEDKRLRGTCMVLRQGRYPTPQSMGLRDQVGSARRLRANEDVDVSRLAPDPSAIYDSRRRRNERLYQADVTSVRAVLGTPERRCWVEREALPDQQGRSNVPATIAGALIGGILGHQVGGGSGRDIATVGGVVAGGLVGNRLGGTDDRPGGYKDVQRCEQVPQSGKPDYWDVTYQFRGIEHRVQATVPPGRTVTVNRDGEPRF